MVFDHINLYSCLEKGSKSTLLDKGYNFSIAAKAMRILTIQQLFLMKIFALSSQRKAVEPQPPIRKNSIFGQANLKVYVYVTKDLLNCKTDRYIFLGWFDSGSRNILF